MELNPPIKHRNTKELFNIISNDKKWTKEAQKLAKEELLYRGFSENIIEEENKKRIKIIEKYNKRNAQIIVKNKQESYSLLEMIIIVVSFPVTLVIFRNSLEEFWYLDTNNYRKKFVQRIFLIAVSIFIWILIFNLFMR